MNFYKTIIPEVYLKNSGSRFYRGSNDI